jgi:hypothetical protein
MFQICLGAALDLLTDGCAVVEQGGQGVLDRG